MRMHLRRKTKNLEKLKKKLNRISKTKVLSGYLEGEMHPTAEMTYAQLMLIHEKGMGNFPSRPVREETLQELRNSLNVKRDIHKDISDYLLKGQPLDSALESIGLSVTVTAQSFFGVLSPTDSNPDPLIDTGKLKENWTWEIDM